MIVKKYIKKSEKLYTMWCNKVKTVQKHNGNNYGKTKQNKNNN